MAERQLSILALAAQLVASAGRLVYSTCTPYQAENEEVVLRFLASHPGWRVESTTLPGCDSDFSGLGAIRLWPHHQGTEPFFACLLRAPSGEDCRGSYTGNMPVHDGAINTWLPHTDLISWQSGNTHFIGSSAAASCVLPSQARGLILRYGERDIEPWATQAIIERGAPARLIAHEDALMLWSGQALPLGGTTKELVKTTAGAPLGLLFGPAEARRLLMPSRMFRSQLQ
jgi:hypothetical protein